MNINKVNRASIANLYQKNNRGETAVEKTGRAVEKDSVTLSKSGNVFNEALKTLKEMPDIRADKVNMVAARLEKSEYKPKSSDIAEKIIENAEME